MPNVKIYTDHAICAEHGSEFVAILHRLRELLCRELKVKAEACQIVALPTYGLPDQVQINVELNILPARDRTSELLRALGEAIQLLFATVTNQKIAVRITTIFPENYLALK